MAKVKILQTNFSAGELSPRAAGRVDIARFPNAAKTLRNVISRTLGGAEKRPGTQYIAAAKHSDKRSRLVPYIVSRDKAFMLEFGDNYMRVFKTDGTSVMSGMSPCEIVTPYDEDAVLEIDYAQGEETMYVFHGDVYPNRLRYFDDDYWNCANAPFTTIPFGELGHKPAADLTLSANTVGAGRTITASSAVFLAGDVDRAIVQEAGVAVITAFTSSTSVVVEVKSVFPSTSIASGSWELDASPMVAIVPQDLKKDKEADPVGSVITITVTSTVKNTLAGSKPIEEFSHAFSTAIATVKVTAHGYSTGDTVVVSGNSPTEYNGEFIITVTDANHFTYIVAYAERIVSLGSVAKVTSTTASGIEAFRAEDVGKFIRIDGGLVKIKTYVSSSQVIGEIIQEMTSPVEAPPLAWTLESPVWSSDNGYPRTGTLHEQRLIAASTKKNPQTVWGSTTGEPLDFTLGSNDDQAFSFTIGSDESTQISFVSSGRDLMVLAYNGEYSMQGGVEKPITPTNVQIKPQTPHGCGTVRPVQVGKELLFVQRAGRKVRAYGYKYDEDGYKSPDITTLAEHITVSGVAEMALQQEPDPVIWVVLNNGGLVSITLDRELDVIAWNSHEIDGFVESVATVPAGDYEQVWMIIRREIDGSDVRYVERFNPDWMPLYESDEDQINWGYMLDCAVSQEDEAGKATWDGLDHLEGRTIRVLADGLDMGNFTVTDGEITLPRDANKILAGLFFAPTIEMLTPEVQLGTGSIQSDAISVNEIGLRVFNTVGATINGALMIPGRSFDSDLLDKPPKLFTGTKFESVIGWGKGDPPPMVISQDSPFPFNVLSVIRSITMNEG